MRLKEYQIDPRDWRDAYAAHVDAAAHEHDEEDYLYELGKEEGYNSYEKNEGVYKNSYSPNDDDDGFMYYSFIDGWNEACKDYNDLSKTVKY